MSFKIKPRTLKLIDKPETPRESARVILWLRLNTPYVPVGWALREDLKQILWNFEKVKVSDTATRRIHMIVSSQKWTRVDGKSEQLDTNGMRIGQVLDLYIPPH